MKIEFSEEKINNAVKTTEFENLQKFSFRFISLEQVFIRFICIFVYIT